MIKCRVSGCNNNVKYIDLCGMHYKRQWRHGDVTVNKTKAKKPTSKCRVEWCSRITTRDDGLCEKHFQRFIRYGRLHKIVNRGSGYTVNGAGYIMIKVNGRWEYLHRILAERALGRRLPEGAVVHHTGNVWDNFRPFDLILCPDQAYHLLLHERMKYANN